MPKYVGNVATERPKRDFGEKLAIAAQGVAQGLQGYAQIKKAEEAQKILADPNSTPIQKAIALANTGQEKLGIEMYKKSADNATLGDIEERLKRNLGIAPSAEETPRDRSWRPDMLPQQQETTAQPGAEGTGSPTQPGFTPGAPQAAARNATALNQPAPNPNMAGTPQVAPMMANAPQGQQQIDSEQQAAAYEQAAQEAAPHNHPVAVQYANKAAQIRKSVSDAKKAEVAKFVGDREYAHKTNKAFHEDVEATSKKLPQAEMLLNMAQQAVDSGEVGPLSRANLAKRLHIKELNSPPGAALDAAVKGALINNVSKLSAKGLNMFMEKVALSAYAQVGESMENNQLKLEAARAELELAKAEIKAYDMQLEQDLQEFGSEQPFLKRRADKFLEPMQKEIADRASYKMKRIKERGDGFAKLDKKWNKQVTHGTPLTPEMGRILLNKTGSPEKMIEVAKKLGYTILSAEQIKSYE